MRRQFGSFVAAILDTRIRIIAHLIQFAPAVFVFLLGLVLPGVLGDLWGTVSLVLWLVVTAAWGLSLLLVLTKSETLGSHFLGFFYVDEATGQRSGMPFLLKTLIEGVLVSGTAGLGAISFVVTYRDGQHWLDRILKVVAVRGDSVEGIGAASMPIDAAVSREPTLPSVLRGSASPQNSTPAMPMQQESFQPAPRQETPSFAPPPPAPEPPKPVGVPPQAAAQPFVPASSSTPPPPNPWASSPSAPVFPPLYAPSAPEMDEPVQNKPGDIDLEALQDTLLVPRGGQLSDETAVDPNPMVPRPTPVVVLDDGQRIAVDGPLVLGRNPTPPSSHSNARPVQLIDATMRLSKTHLVIVPQADGLDIIDIGATNGVFVEASGERSRLVVREPHRLRTGQLIHFGGRTMRLVS